jgi:hypothetical protein
LTLCTLLSSQGSDAPKIQPHGHQFGATSQPYTPDAQLEPRSELPEGNHGTDKT